MAIVAAACKKPFYVASESTKFVRMFPLSQQALPESEPKKPHPAFVNGPVPDHHKVEYPPRDYTPPQVSLRRGAAVAGGVEADGVVGARRVPCSQPLCRACRSPRVPSAERAPRRACPRPSVPLTTARTWPAVHHDAFHRLGCPYPIRRE